MRLVKRSKSKEELKSRAYKADKPTIISPVIDDPEFTGRNGNKLLLKSLSPNKMEK
jgi:hypothetical protein